MARQPPPASDADDDYGSFDPATIVKGNNNGNDALKSGPGPSSGDTAMQMAAPDAPTSTIGANDEAANQSLITKTVPSDGQLNSADQRAPMPAATTDPSGHETDNNAAREAARKAADEGTPSGTPVAGGAPPLEGSIPPPPSSNIPGTDYPPALFDAIALVELANRVSHLNRGLALRLRIGATDSVVMDARDLQKLREDFDAANLLVSRDGAPNGNPIPTAAGHPSGAASVALQTQLEPINTSGAAASSLPPAAPVNPRNSTSGAPSDASQPASTSSTATGATNAHISASKGAADGTANGNASGNADGKVPPAHTSNGASASGNAVDKEGGAKEPVVPLPTHTEDDPGELGDSESSSDDEADEIPPANDHLSSVDEVMASLTAVFDAVEYAAPRKESSARPTSAQMHAVVLVEQHVRHLAEFVSSRIGLSQERLLRNVVDMAPARMGNNYNLFRPFLKCTDDYAPRRELDDLLGRKSKYKTREQQDLYAKLQEKLGQEKLDELLIAFDVRYPYGVPEPTVGDREKTFDGSARRLESMFRYFAANHDFEGFFCIVGANSLIDRANMTRFFSTFHARRVLATKLFTDEAEIKTFVQTAVQDSVNNTRAAEKLVARGRTLPLFVDLNDALRSANRSVAAAAPQPRRKGRGVTIPKMNETYFDVVKKFLWSRNEHLKNCVPLLSGYGEKLFVVSMPWPGGARNAMPGSDFNCEYTQAELEVAIIEFRRMFEEAGIALGKSRGFPLAAAFRKLIHTGYMIYGWPPGVYMFNESRNKMNFDGLGWPMRCLLVMYILCGYLRICKADSIPVECLDTLPPLPNGKPFRIVCITDAIPDVPNVDKSFHGTHRAFFDNEIVIGMHTSLVNRAVPTTIPRPDPELHPWKGVRAWNEERRKANLSTVDLDKDVPFTPAARDHVAEDDDDDNNEEQGDGEAQERADEGAGKGNGAAEGNPKGTSSSAARKKSNAPGPSKKPAAAKTSKKRKHKDDSDNEGASGQEPRTKKSRVRKPVVDRDTDEERKRLRAKAIKKQKAGNTNPFPTRPRSGNMEYIDIDSEDGQPPKDKTTVRPADAAGTAGGNGTRSSNEDPSQAQAATADRAPPATGNDNAKAPTVVAADPLPSPPPPLTAAQSGHAIPPVPRAMLAKSPVKAQQGPAAASGGAPVMLSPRRSQRQREAQVAETDGGLEEIKNRNAPDLENRNAPDVENRNAPDVDVSDGEGMPNLTGRRLRWSSEESDAVRIAKGKAKAAASESEESDAVRLAKGKAKAAASESDGEYQGPNSGSDEQSGSDRGEDNDDEHEDEAPATSDKRSAPRTTKKRAAAVRRPAAAAARGKSATETKKRKWGAKANDDDGEDDAAASSTVQPPAKRVRRPAAYSKFTHASRVPRGEEYDFLFSKRVEFKSKDGIIMKVKKTNVALPQALLDNQIIIEALDKASKDEDLTSTQRAIIQYVYDVWPSQGNISDEMDRIFSRVCKFK